MFHMSAPSAYVFIALYSLCIRIGEAHLQIVYYYTIVCITMHATKQ
jgi:hypothetical protein